MSNARISLGDAVQDARGSFTIPSVRLPAAWTILFAGLLGLRALTSGPGVARVVSWATISRSRAPAPSSALDPVDPARYALAPAPRSRQGHFVRAASASRFGPEM